MTAVPLRQDAEAIEELLRQDVEQGLRSRDLEAAGAPDEEAGAPTRRRSEVATKAATPAPETREEGPAPALTYGLRNNGPWDSALFCISCVGC